ncbi:MAG: diphthine--ammonia ligase [Candidatus Omnitrophica bacterium]|nr:diphthine--ammonia ligase [Candidatus Omnitrophota bacterium]
MSTVETTTSTSVIASWSGGKDCCLATYRAMQQGYKIAYLLNFISRDSQRACFHGIERELMHLQSQRIGIPIVQKETTADMLKYEEEFKEAVKDLMNKGLTAMVFGDIYLLDHQSWVERVCSEIGIKPIEPLWEESPRKLLEEFIDAGFKAIVVSCQADKFDQDFIGRIIDKEVIDELEARKICPCGENGEFHTLVIDGPIFKEPIEIVKSEPVLKEGFWKHWFLDIKEYR